MTSILPSNENSSWKEAAALLRSGSVVAFPTDTVYGLGAIMEDSAAVEKLFLLKKRPKDKAIVIFIASLEMAWQLVIPPSTKVQALLNNFWPGALTAIFPKRSSIPEGITGGRPGLGLRMPNCERCLNLVREVGQPLAVTSANLSNEPTPKTAVGVAQALGKELPLVIDSGATTDIKPSSVVDFAASPPVLLREGELSLEKLKEHLPTLNQ